MVLTIWFDAVHHKNSSNILQNKNVLVKQACILFFCVFSVFSVLFQRRVCLAMEIAAVITTAVITTAVVAAVITAVVAAAVCLRHMVISVVAAAVAAAVCLRHMVISVVAAAVAAAVCLRHMVISVVAAAAGISAIVVPSTVCLHLLGLVESCHQTRLYSPHCLLYTAGLAVADEDENSKDLSIGLLEGCPVVVLGNRRVCDKVAVALAQVVEVLETATSEDELYRPAGDVDDASASHHVVTTAV